MTERLKSLEPCRCCGCPWCYKSMPDYSRVGYCFGTAEYHHNGIDWCPECLDELKQREFEEQLDSFIENQAKKEH